MRYRCSNSKAPQVEPDPPKAAMVQVKVTISLSLMEPYLIKQNLPAVVVNVVEAVEEGRSGMRTELTE